MSESSTVQESAQRSIIVRAVWFVLVGWWATGVWLGIAWLLNVTIIGIPLGIKMINWVPMVVSLRRRQQFEIVSDGDVESHGLDQFSLVIRAVWFVFVGWWASGVWMSVAYLFTISIIGLPVAVWMYNKLPFVVSLYRY